MRRTTIFLAAAMLAALSGAAGAHADDSLTSSSTALNQSDPLAPADDSTLSAPKSNLVPDQIPGQVPDKAPAADAKAATTEPPAKSLTPNADAEAAKAAAQARARAEQAAEARAAAAAEAREGGDREEMMEQRMEAQQERMEAMQERAEMIGDMLSGD